MICILLSVDQHDASWLSQRINQRLNSSSELTQSVKKCGLQCTQSMRTGRFFIASKLIFLLKDP